MTPEQQKVLEFHKCFQLTIKDRPGFPSPEDQELRRKLIVEEASEFCDAKTLKEIADGLGDLLYVVYGAAITYGIDLGPVFNEIHRSNMTKLWNGQVQKNEFGKVIKPPTYSPANIAAEIERQMIGGAA